MATRPELHIAVAKTKSKASDYNDNFDMMMDFIDNSIDESKDYVEGFMPDMTGYSGALLETNGTTASWKAIPTILQTIYPVGSIYIGTMETCPLAALFGTWTLKSTGRVLQGSDSEHAAGTTIAAGLPDHRHSVATAETPDGTGRLVLGSGGGSSTYYSAYASASSSIYGNSTTVQPPAYVVNIWERTS